jgi:predicted phage-related endonuclease
VLEIKTTGIQRGDDWEEEAPLGYQVQLQHYLAVTGRRWGSFAVLIGGQKFRWYDVERNDKFIASLEARCEWFWGLVQRQEAPPVDDSQSTAEALRSIYAGESGETVDLGAASVDWCQELEAAKAAIAEAEARKRGAENQIKAALGAASCGIVPGLGKFSFKAQRREAHQVAASEFRVLRFTKMKGGK